MGKTSSASSLFNVSGKASWIAMELVSPLTLLYTILTHPSEAVLIPTHSWLTILFCVHYAHRAIISPLRNPSMASTHVFIPLAAACFNLCNGSLIGGWLAGYYGHPATGWQVGLGSAIFLSGFVGNVFHEEVLRRIRSSPSSAGITTVVGGRVYGIPEKGLFKYCWHPHVSFLFPLPINFFSPTPPTPPPFIT
jgi:3-oxo-5-alpha-steroid 4-dehydrogenase 1